MSDLTVERAIVRTYWRELDRALDRTIDELLTGRGRSVSDPFKGVQTELPLTPGVKLLRDEFEKHSLSMNSELLAVLRELIREVSTHSMMGFLAAIDGESVLEDGVEITLHDGDGNELVHCFHEIFHGEDPKRQDS